MVVHQVGNHLPKPLFTDVTKLCMYLITCGHLK